MRATLITLCLFLVGCGGAKPEPSLEGVWHEELTEPDGAHFESVITISKDGSYTCQISVTREGEVREYIIEGTMVVEDGFLIESVLRTSSGEIENPPISTRYRILEFDENELTIEFLEDHGTLNGTNRISTFRRVKN